MFDTAPEVRAPFFTMRPGEPGTFARRGRIDANLKIGVPVTADIAFDSAVFVLFEKALGMQ